MRVEAETHTSTELPDTVNRTYIDQASYWLTYCPLRGFHVLFDLAQVINLVFIFIKKRCISITVRWDCNNRFPQALGPYPSRDP